MPTGNEKVLIVDDERLNIKLLLEILKKHYTIIVAKNGDQALERAMSEELPDLILLDIMMPDINGFQVCKQLKTNDRTKNIPIIFITARDDAEDEAKGLVLGAVDYITKPFHPAVVMARVRTHLLLKRKTDLLEKTASMDGLTELANRRRFDEAFEIEWKRAKRNQTILSLILSDIDFFKQFNDNYGHAAGDQCLRRVSRTLAETIKRPADLLARYGGEEFAVILPETAMEGAEEIAEQMRENVWRLNIPHRFSKADDRVTMSLGVATTVPIKNHTSTELIEAADGMLYKAKGNGRNQHQSTFFR